MPKSKEQKRLEAVERAIRKMEHEETAFRVRYVEKFVPRGLIYSDITRSLIDPNKHEEPAMRESVRLIRAALVSKGYTQIRTLQTSRASNSDTLTWYTRLDADKTSVHVVLLQEYECGLGGCELFIQATTSNSVDKAIEAIP